MSDPSRKEDRTWLAELREGGELAFRVGRCGSRIVAEWPGVARFEAEADASEMVFSAEPCADPRAIAKLRRGAVAAFERQLRGKLSLHGSAVSRDGRAVLFLGGTGSGKSTLAAALSRRAGWSLVADDMVAVEKGTPGFVLVPTEGEHWLDRPSREALGLGITGDEGKEPVEACSVAGVPAALCAVARLSFTEGAPRIVALRGRAALEPLVHAVARFVLDDPRVLAREFSQIASLRAHVPVVELCRTSDLRDLAGTVDLVEQWSASLDRAERRGTPT